MISFTVYGEAKPAGSKRAFAMKSGKIAVTDANPNSKSWKQEVKAAAFQATGNAPFPPGIPLRATFHFFRQRPKSHLRKDGSIKPSAPPLPVTKPDALKLARAIEDACTGICYHDDAQITSEHLYKRYAEFGPHVEVSFTEDK